MRQITLDLTWFSTFVAEYYRLDESQHHDRGTGPYVPDRKLREAWDLIEKAMKEDSRL